MKQTLSNLKQSRNRIQSKFDFYFSVILITTVMLTSSVITVGVNSTTNDKQSGRMNFKSESGRNKVNESSFQGYKNSLIHPNVQVNAKQQPFPNGLLGRSETTIAASKDGMHLVAGWNDAQGLCGAPFGYSPCPPAGGFSGYAYSTNGGKNWTDGGAPPIINGVYTRGDPWLASDGNTFFYSNLAINDTTGASIGIAVFRGHFTRDGNFTWTDVHVMDAPANTLYPGSDLYDKESITVAKDGSGTAYVTLTNFQETCGIPQFGFGTITVWRTHDGGNNWKGPVVVSPDQTFITNPSNPQCGYTGHIQLGSVVGIGPHGTVYDTWVLGPTFTSTGISPYAKIMVATSHDGGATFGQPVVVGQINDSFYDTPVAFNRPYILETPSISAARGGPDRGRVFISYVSTVNPILNPNPSSQTLTSTQVFLAYSTNEGQTWKNVQVVAPPPATTVKRFYPVVVTESNGNPDVIYYQSIENPSTSTNYCVTFIPQDGSVRIGLAHSLMDVYWAHSGNFGKSFNKPLRVTSVTTDWCSVTSNMYPNMGDYIGATTAGTHIYTTWADGRNGVPDTFFSSMHATGNRFFMNDYND